MSKVIYETECGRFWIAHVSNRTKMAPVSDIDAFAGSSETVSLPDVYEVRGGGFGASSLLHGSFETEGVAIFEADRLSVEARRQAEIVAGIVAW